MEKYHTSDRCDYDDTLNFAKYTTRNRLFMAVLFSFLTVVGSGSGAYGDLLDAPNRGLLDFSSSAARIPGPAWKNMSQLRGYLNRQGIGLVEDGAWYLDKFGPNKWRRSTGAILDQ
jgi:hypothetical protein